jgi:hypothetical protein
MKTRLLTGLLAVFMVALGIWMGANPLNASCDKFLDAKKSGCTYRIDSDCVDQCVVTTCANWYLACADAVKCSIGSCYVDQCGSLGDCPRENPCPCSEV